METKDITLRELVERLSHLRDDETFRWFQASTTSYLGVPQATVAYRVTMGQARRELLDIPDVTRVDVE